MSDSNIRRVLDCSTAHLPQEERDWLFAGELVQQSMHGDYGGLVYISDAVAWPDKPDDMSEALHAIIVYAASLDCQYILFDTDGPYIGHLPVFADAECG